MKTSEVRTNLRSSLVAFLPKESVEHLAYHLGDLHHAFLRASVKIEELSAKRDPSASLEVRTLLSQLMGELYEHMPAHFIGAKEILEPWVQRLYDEAESRGEL